MLLSKQSVLLGYCLNFSVPSPVNDLMKRGRKDLAYLFLPEDTTDHTDLARKDSINPLKDNTRSTVKVVFWLAASITISLMLGQLQ